MGLRAAGHTAPDPRRQARSHAGTQVDTQVDTQADTQADTAHAGVRPSALGGRSHTAPAAHGVPRYLSLQAEPLDASGTAPELAQATEIAQAAEPASPRAPAPPDAQAGAAQAPLQAPDASGAATAQAETSAVQATTATAQAETATARAETATVQAETASAETADAAAQPQAEEQADADAATEQAQAADSVLAAEQAGEEHASGGGDEAAGGTGAAQDEDAAAGDLALIDEELAEHERWAGSFGSLGTAGSDARARFLLERTGKGAASGLGGGLGMGFAMGAIGGAVGQIAGRRLATLAVSRGATAVPVPGLGPAIGGVMAVAGLAMRDWGTTATTIGRMGTGEGYEGLANDLEGLAEILDVACSIMDVVGGVLGGIAVGMWIGAVLSAGALSPLALTLSAIATGITLATTAIGIITSVVIRPAVTALRALHSFESQGDPAQIEAEGALLESAAGQVTGAVGGALGGRAGGRAGSRGGTHIDRGARHLAARRGGQASMNASARPGPALQVTTPGPAAATAATSAPATPHPVTPDIVIRGDYSDAALKVLGTRNRGDAAAGDIGGHRTHQGRRGSEFISEHVIPGAQMRDASMDPRAGAPDWQRSTPGGSDGRDYNRATTIIENAAVSARKTTLDNAETAALQARGGPRNLVEDLLLPSLERHQRATDDAIRAGEIRPDQATDPTHRALAALTELWEGGSAGGGASARARAAAAGESATLPRRADRRRAAERERLRERIEEEGGIEDIDWDATFPGHRETSPASPSQPPPAGASRAVADAAPDTASSPHADIARGLFSGPPILGPREGRELGRQLITADQRERAAEGAGARAPAYTAAAAGLAPGESIEVPVNPAYAPPPGTTAELEALRVQIGASRSAEAVLGATREHMAEQADEQRTHDAELGTATDVTADLAQGRQAHQAEVDGTAQANTSMASEAGAAVTALGRSAQEAGAVATLVGSLRAFQGMADLFSLLPGSLGRRAERASADTTRLIAALNRVSDADAAQAEVEAGRGTIDADAGRIETVAAAGAGTDEALASGQAGVSTLQAENAASLAETEATQEQADTELTAARETENDAHSTHDALLGQLQTWAQVHRQAREDAIRAAIAQYEASGLVARELN